MAIVRRSTAHAALIVLAAPFVAAPVAHAADIDLDHFAAGAVTLDGKPLMSEWPNVSPGLVTIVEGKGTAAFNAGYDDEGLYLAADVSKPGGALVRTGAMGENEDVVLLDLAIPKAGVNGELVGYAIALYAGGNGAGAVKVQGKNATGARIVDAVRKGGGYTLEAFVPWGALGEGKRTHVGMRGAFRARFAEGAVKGTTNATLDAPASMPRLLIEPEQTIAAALASKKLGWEDVRYDVVADLVGDATNERALFAGRSLFLFGPTFRGGHQWGAMDLGLDVAKVEVKDVTADGHGDLLVTTRVKAPTSMREALHVWSVIGDSPVDVFAHETKVEGAGTLEDDVAFGAAKGKGAISVRYRAAKGWDASSYREPTATDIDPILLPWGVVKERLFTFDAGAHAFKLEKEVAQEGSAPTVASSGSAPTSTPTPTNLAPTTVKGSADAAIAAYKKDKGLAASTAPRFDVPIAVGGGKQGRAVLFGRDLLLAEDAGFAFVSMQRFAADEDVKKIEVADLSGDGRDEILVRGVMHAKLSGGSGDKGVLREVIVVYSPKVQGSTLAIAPVFAVEVARAIGDDRVEASVAIAPAKNGKPGTITVSKGTAKGFTKASWPFGEETPTSDLAPLVLPWSTPSSVTYVWSNDKLVAQ